MKVASVICEYNPFHNGHKFLNDEIKKSYADALVCIMSTSFTQRGDIAIHDKFSRAKTALENGADLVVELPVVYAVSSAETFAKSGVAIAKNLKSDLLCFGSESDDLSSLLTAADALCDKRVYEKTLQLLKKGESFPKSQQTALNHYYGKDISDIISTPNNILAVEYLKALKNTDISPVAIKRLGVSHDSDEIYENIASASNIRNMIRNCESFENYIPKNTEECENISLESLEKIILYKLKSMKEEDFLMLSDISEGLENRFIDSIKNSDSLKEILDSVKTKRYTMARLRRIVICALLDITKELQITPVPYIRVLGLNQNGREILRNAADYSEIPIITKASAGYRNLSQNAKAVFDREVFASDVYSLALSKALPHKNDFTQNPILCL